MATAGMGQAHVSMFESWCRGHLETEGFRGGKWAADVVRASKHTVPAAVRLTHPAAVQLAGWLLP